MNGRLLGVKVRPILFYEKAFINKEVKSVITLAMILKSSIVAS